MGARSVIAGLVCLVCILFPHMDPAQAAEPLKPPGVRWKNTHDKGAYGDYITALRLTGMQYDKLPSKLNRIHGIDGVYRPAQGDTERYLVVETKVNSATLDRKRRQMSISWIREKIYRMLRSPYLAVRRTGMLLDSCFWQEDCEIIPELWHHDFRTGTTRVYVLDAQGHKKEMIYDFQDRMMRNCFQRSCRSGRLDCQD